jgi:hypothetical protein
MKKISLLLAMFALSIFSMSAQCVLRYTPSSGEGQSYTSLDQAYADAQDDDILYLSGHTFQFSTNAVEKRLQWVGAGIISDSTYATGSTRINPTNNSSISFIIHPQAGGSSFTGINFGGFRLNDCDVSGEISLVTFTRCKFMSDWISLSFVINLESQLHYRFQECIFNTIVYGNGFCPLAPSDITFDNCIFTHGLFRLRTGTYNFRNCTLWAAGASDGISQSEGCSFLNCIFWDAANTAFIDAGYMASGNVFDHCAFSHPTIPVYGSGANPTQINSCIAGVTTLFVNTNDNFTYEEDDDYNLLAGSEALTAGIADGQTGIYGGDYPVKPGYVPFNPHISSKNIAPATVNGLLNVNFITTSQNH